MKPIAIFRHSPIEGPGYFATYLDRAGHAWREIRIDEGEAVPDDATAFSGLCFMGGPMSVNDDLPWIPRVLALIRDAVTADIPVIGHCLGGQLMSRALGGTVTRNAVKEIGWGVVQASTIAVSRQWLGDIETFDAFHWHGETFSVPEGAVGILSSRYCANQAFVLGPHLAMQCHVEMTPELIAAWCRDWERELVSRASPSVQTPAQMIANVGSRVEALHTVSDRLYEQWVKGLRD